MINKAPGMFGLTKFRVLFLFFMLTFFLVQPGPVFADEDVTGGGEKTHVVKPGEHLYGIAEKFDVSLSDLRKANNIEGNIIRPGQELLIPVDGVVQTADAPGLTDPPEATKDSDITEPPDITEVPGVTAETPDNTANSPLPANTTISLDIRDADLRDVLSALAIKMNAHVLLVEAPHEVNFKVDNVSPQKAFQLLLQQEGLTYIKDGNLYIVGQDGTLESDFFNHMVLTRFNLNYIPASTLEGVLSQLGIPLQSITLAENERSMWVQATPLSLSKVRQVVAALDRPENADPEDPERLVSLELKCFNLNHISAEMLQDVLGELLADDDEDIILQSIVLDTNPQTLWVQGTSRALTILRELIATFDIPENSEAAQPLKRYNLQYVSASKLEDLAGELDISMRSLVIQANPRVFWAQAPPQELKKLEELISAVDRSENLDSAHSVFVYNLENTLAVDVEDRLEAFGFGREGADVEGEEFFGFDANGNEEDAVQIITFNYSEYSKEILVICPPYLESQVRSALSKLDEARQRVRIPVASASGDAARSQLVAERELVSELTGISIGRMHISSNLSGDSDNPYYVLWIEESPDKVQMVANMIDTIRSPD